MDSAWYSGAPDECSWCYWAGSIVKYYECTNPEHGHVHVNSRKESVMTQHTEAPSIAALIGETPEMMRLCGRILQLEHDKASMDDRTYRENRRSLQHHVRVMQRLQANPVSDIRDGSRSFGGAK